MIYLLDSQIKNKINISVVHGRVSLIQCLFKKKINLYKALTLTNVSNIFLKRSIILTLFIIDNAKSRLIRVIYYSNYYMQ